MASTENCHCSIGKHALCCQGGNKDSEGCISAGIDGKCCKRAYLPALLVRVKAVFVQRLAWQAAHKHLVIVHSTHARGVCQKIIEPANICTQFRPLQQHTVPSRQLATVLLPFHIRSCNQGTHTYKSHIHVAQVRCHTDAILWQQTGLMSEVLRCMHRMLWVRVVDKPVR